MFLKKRFEYRPVSSVCPYCGGTAFEVRHVKHILLFDRVPTKVGVSMEQICLDCRKVVESKGAPYDSQGEERIVYPGVIKTARILRIPADILE